MNASGNSSSMGNNNSKHYHHHYPQQSSQVQVRVRIPSRHSSGHSSREPAVASTRPSNNHPQLLFHLEATNQYVYYDKASDAVFVDGQWLPRPTNYTVAEILDAFDRYAAPHYFSDASGTPQIQYTTAYIPDPARADNTRETALQPMQVIMGDPLKVPDMPNQRQQQPVAAPAPYGSVNFTHAPYQAAPPAAGLGPGHAASQQAPPNITINAERGATVVMRGLNSLYAVYPQAPPSLVVNAAENSRVLFDYGANTGYTDDPAATSSAYPNVGNAAFNPFEPVASMQALPPSSRHLAIEQAPVPQPWKSEAERTSLESAPLSRETRGVARYLPEASRGDRAPSPRRRHVDRKPRHQRRRRSKLPLIDLSEPLSSSSDDSGWSSPSSVRSYSPRRRW